MKIKRLTDCFLLLLAAGMLAACSSNEDNGTNGGKKVDVAKTVEFNVEFADYNSDREVPSRAACDQANDTLYKKLVKVNDKMLAEVTVKRDTPKMLPLAKTRALEDGIYTMIAYQGTTYKGETTGTISSGVFHYSSNKALDLEPGTYTFVLCNDKVSRNGNDITVTEANAGTALIGRSIYTVPSTPAHQKVTFTMKHVSTRVRYKIISYMPILKPAGAYSSSMVKRPTIAVYHPETDTWTGDANAYFSHPMTYTGGSTPDADEFYNAISDYVYILAPIERTHITFKLGGDETNIYGVNFAISNINLPSLVTLAPNSSFTVTYKFLYDFLYLMNDGKTGGYTSTWAGGGYNTPIAVVVSKNKHLAVALKDAHNGQSVQWYYKDDKVHTMNNVLYSNPGHTLEASYGDMRGYQYTWNANTAFDATTRKGDNKTEFPAFYYAGHYGDELTAAGKPLYDQLAGKKFHLPSNGEFTYLYYNLGFGGSLNRGYLQGYSWYEKLANSAFTQVGGDGILYDDQHYDYWTSTEIVTGFSQVGIGVGHVIRYKKNQLMWTWYTRDSYKLVRPFIYYQ